MPITTSGTPVATRNDRLADFPALQRRFDQAGFQQASQTHGVDASVLVQVLNSEAETTEFLRLAAAPGSRIAGEVGWTDLTNPSIADELARLKAQPGGNFWSWRGSQGSSAVSRWWWWWWWWWWWCGRRSWSVTGSRAGHGASLPAMLTFAGFRLRHFPSVATTCHSLRRLTRRYPRDKCRIPDRTPL
jgi:hypothetical protein